MFCFFPLYSTAFLLYKNDLLVLWGALGGAVVKNLTPNTGDSGLIPESGRCPGAGNGNPLQYSCLENPTDGGAWRATVHRVTKSQTTKHSTAYNKDKDTYFDVLKLE